MSISLLGDKHLLTIYHTIYQSMEAINEDQYFIRSIVELIDNEVMTGDSDADIRAQVLLKAHDYLKLLNRMNIDVYNEKYNQNSKPTLRFLGYKKYPILKHADLYLALHCLEYQIEEDYLTESKLEEHLIYNSLLFLTLLKGNVATKFLKNSASYKNSKTWEIM